MKWLIIIVAIYLLWPSTDECREYSDFTCEEIQEADYNIYFSFPSGSQEYLGQTNGLDSCGDIAWGYAAEKELSSNSGWGYVCCMIANGSSCYEKHR